MAETTAAQRPDESQGIGPGTVLSERYRVIRLVGEGGMGRVYLAEDIGDGRQVALKLLADDRPMPRAAERFTREARSIARIDHDNVVRIFHVGESPRGGLYYVMEYLEGEELADTLDRDGPLPWRRAVGIAEQVCSALQAAHEKGVVHRDLKLENCFRVERNGNPDYLKILDFGVAKLLAPDPAEGERLTNTGATLGTPAYMAPELCRGKDVDHRVDIYALGVMLYELLTGTVPFEGDSFLDVALQHMNDPPPPLSRHLLPEELPPALEAAVMRALAKAREDRFPTMSSFGRALRKVLDDEDQGPLKPAPLRSTEPVLELPKEEAAISTEPGPEGRNPAAAGSTRPALAATGAGETSGSTIEVPGAAVTAGGTVVTKPPGRGNELSGGTMVSTENSGPLPRSTVPSVTGLPPVPDDELRPGEGRAKWIVAVFAVGLALGAAAWWMSSGDEGTKPKPKPEAPAVEAKIETDAETKAAAEVEAPAPTTGEPEAATAAEESGGSGGAAAPADSGGEAKATSGGQKKRPSGLRPGQISKGFKSISPLISACVGLVTGGKPGDQIKAKVRIDRATGKVLSASARVLKGSPSVGPCVREALLKARFPAGGRGEQTVSKRLKL